ncbi:MAG: cyclic nucleotide-binding domain-containing protein [Thermoanaerobaculia bacterium]
MNQIFQAQSDHPLFRYFDEAERQRVESLAEMRRLDDGDYLIRESESDSTLYAVEDGRLEIVVRRDGKETVTATVGPGDVLGEVSFIDDSPRTVSVRAAEDATAVRAWKKSALTNDLAGRPDLLAKFAVAMSELLVERLRDSVRRQGAYRPI